MSENNRRIQRVASQIKTELSWLIERELKDPSKGFLTITRVKISPDLKIASIYYSVLGDENERKSSEDALTRAKSFLKRELGNKLSMRFTPDLRFFYDHSLEYAGKIESLINKIHDNENNR